MNEVVTDLRSQGALIIHAPSGCMDYYAGSRARHRAAEAPQANASVPIGWNNWNPDREGPLPAEITDPGPCSCRAPEPCCTGEPPYPWTRQIDGLDIVDQDVVSDVGQEVFNVLSGRQIDDILFMGVHTNICVLGRPFGIRQMVYFGKRPVLCRDLTDSFHRLPGEHAEGTRLVIDHIERHWCSTIGSDELVGGKPFVFSGFNDT